MRIDWEHILVYVGNEDCLRVENAAMKNGDARKTGG